MTDTILFELEPQYDPTPSRINEWQLPKIARVFIYPDDSDEYLNELMKTGMFRVSGDGDHLEAGGQLTAYADAMGWSTMEALSSLIKNKNVELPSDPSSENEDYYRCDIFVSIED